MINDFRIAVKNGYKRVLGQAPCGFGKTPTMVTMIKGAEEKGKKILFLCSRKELIDQCSDMLRKEYGIEHGVLGDKDKCNIMANVQLTCWQKLVRSNKMNSWKPDIIFFDECHGSVAEKVKEIIDMYPDAFLFGFTATPYRDDGLGLKPTYEIIIETCSMEDLIEEGRLIKPEYYVCNDVITTTTAITDDEEEVDSDEVDVLIKADLIRNFSNICPTAKTCVFCPSIERAKEIAQKFENAGFSARAVDCKTPKKERKQILKDFADGKFQIICNSSLLKEGWDCPDLECVILLRRLKSRVFYRQACGRCMRISKNKPNKKAFILDFFNCVETHGFPWESEKYSLEEDVIRISKDLEKDKDDINKPLWCANCSYHLEEKDCGVCPLCKRKIEVMNKIIAEAIEDLKKITTIVSRDEKQEKYNELAAKCIQYNRKPGWVSHQYKEVFGVWPRKMKKTKAFEDYCKKFETGNEQKELSL